MRLHNIILFLLFISSCKSPSSPVEYVTEYKTVTHEEYFTNNIYYTNTVYEYYTNTIGRYCDYIGNEYNTHLFFIFPTNYSLLHCQRCGLKVEGVINEIRN